MLTLLALASLAAPLLACVLATWQASPELAPLSVVDLGENVCATPVLAPGRVYLRTTAALYCFGTRP